MLQSELGMTEEEVNKQWGGYISITLMLAAYDKLFHRYNELEQPSDEEEAKELDKTRTMCIKAFLFLLVRQTILANKNSKIVHRLWLTMLQDLDTVHESSWDGMALAFLYT